MFYKIDLMPDGTLEVVDRVEEADYEDGYIYATEADYDRLDKRIVKDISYLLMEVAD